MASEEQDKTEPPTPFKLEEARRKGEVPKSPDLGGVLVMGGAVMIFFLLPWLDRSKVRSIRYRGWISKTMLTLFVICFLVLGWLGLQPGSELQTLVARICTFFYFAFFITMPLWTAIDKTKPVPERVTSHA